MKTRVLVAEDEETPRRLIATVLSMMNCEVRLCTDGKSAIEALETESGFDVLITDFSMPYANGIEVMRAAMNAGVKRMGLQSGGLYDPTTIDEIGRLNGELLNRFNGDSKFEMLPKPYGLSTLEQFLISLGINK